MWHTEEIQVPSMQENFPTDPNRYKAVLVFTEQKKRIGVGMASH